MTTGVAWVSVTRVCDHDLRVQPHRVSGPSGLRSSPDSGVRGCEHSVQFLQLWVSLAGPASPGPEKMPRTRRAELQEATGSRPGCWSPLDSSGKLLVLGWPYPRLRPHPRQAPDPVDG